MKTFSNIRFKKKTVQRFQGFSRRFFKTHTEALDTMLDFFVYNEISPKETLGPNARTLEANIKKRINALVAIIKDIEKHQTQPTTAMLQLLFEQDTTKEKKSRLVAVNPKDKSFKEDSFATSLEAIELKKQKNILQGELNDTKKQLEDILFSKIQIIKPSFGKPKLQLDMSIEAFEALKEKIKNT
ncbi:BfmA/BtgA family mobilization protein [Tamlana sp. 2201CG12-4]|uniref:BfmA/BtgA family mobilization protein n=1 Tax=Tamlana sp. 2201CG12-4 TaxID=3112582 RepID=UPI002DB73202|nr:BfmA/BtgA family mobilization protein [Tamlana sp. 2201CG12-4]MEC3905972.1 BfmA/BtgA family mobilization protein [Tamlana sp. 2201CG12-4]